MILLARKFCRGILQRRDLVIPSDTVLLVMTNFFLMQQDRYHSV